MGFLDLTGQVFGKLTVISLYSMGEHGAKWKCQCSCGNITFSLGGSLRSGGAKSCGCSRKDVIRYIDLAGQKFNRLTVIDKAEKTDSNFGVYWNCICDCGNKTVAKGSNIKASRIRSCGCYAREKRAENAYKAGKANSIYGELSKLKEFGVWRAMITRCEGGNKLGEKYYKNRGIKVCNRWLNSFENFINDMGFRPSDAHKIDRIDNNGNYEPKNCRWVEQRIQMRNKRDNTLITYNNKTLCITDWAKEVGLNKGTLIGRIQRKKWPIHEALTLPPAKTDAERKEYSKLTNTAPEHERQLLRKYNA